VGMTSSDSSSSIRIVPSPGSGGTGLGGPEASSSGASSGPPSPIDMRVLRDFEVMKAGHDLDTTVTEGSLAAIREWYNILVEYELHVPGSDGSRRSVWNVEGIRRENPSVRATVPAWEIDVSPMREAPKTSSKRPTDASTERIDDLFRRHKNVKILSRRHKSRHGEGGSWSHSKGKEPAMPVKEPETLVESTEEDASLVFHRLRSMKDLYRTKVQKDDAGYYALYMSDLAHQDPDKETQTRWGKLKNSTKVWNDPSTPEEFEKGLLHPQLAWELYTLPSEVLLARATKEMVLMVLFDRVNDTCRLITFMDYRITSLQQEIDVLKSGEGPEAVAATEERAFELEKELEKTKRKRDEVLQRLKASDKELNEARGNLSEVQKQLKEARALESARAELPRQAVDDYKESIGFKEDLKRMGRVTYEYGYRVALARFRSLHPDSKVEEDPFTIRPEDDSVPMERQQAFDDSDPPESL
ncbi:hypothetical protein BHE74_00059609, partial [Ensete ventricosum]